MADTPTTKTGVFPCGELDIMFDTSAVEKRSDKGNETFTKVEELESGSFSIETSVENWTPYGSGGWQRALATAKKITLSFSGKRNYGSAGNDYIAGKAFLNGQACNSTMKIAFPDGKTFTMPCVIKTSNFGLGDSTAVGPLEFEVESDGKPTYE